MTDTRPAPLTLPNVTETAFSKLIDGKRRYVACTEAAALDGLRWSDPASPVSTKALVTLYGTGEHTANGGRLTPQLRAAVAKFSGHTPISVLSVADFLNKLRAGYVVTVAGDYGAFGTTLARWDIPFARNNHPAKHEICIGPIATGDNSPDPWVWLRDPLGHGSGYHGQWVRFSTIVGTRNASGEPDSGWGLAQGRAATGYWFGPADCLAYPPSW